MGQSYP